MRCIAIGQRWKSKIGPVVFVTRELPEFLVQRLADEGFEHEQIDTHFRWLDDARSLSNRIETGGHQSCVVIDGYSFNENYQRIVNQTGSKVLIVDDQAHCSSYHADFLLNPNLHAFAAKYDGLGSCELLLGTQYALLRSEFVNIESSPSTVAEAGEPECRLLVSLGGVRATKIYCMIIEAIGQIPNPDLRVTIVAPDHELVSTDSRISIVGQVENMSKLYRWADLAIAAGGSSNWEMCYFGLPRLVVVMADNQEPVARSLAARDCCWSLGEAHQIQVQQIRDQLLTLMSSPDLQKTMSQRNRQIVDGKGAERVVNRLVDSLAPCRC